MNTKPKRPYRKNLQLSGLVFVNGKEWDGMVKNLSITGMLLQLKRCVHDDIEEIMASIAIIPIIDIYIPEFRLAGEAEVVRSNLLESGNLELALQFKSIHHQVDQWQYKRQAFRKDVTETGRIVLGDHCYEFTSVNVSVGGLMIRLPHQVLTNEGAIAEVEFAHLGLKGKAKVVWVDVFSDAGTLMGLQYLGMRKSIINDGT